jgi:hypothetical protein
MLRLTAMGIDPQLGCEAWARQRPFDRIDRIDWIMIFHWQAGCLPVNSSAPAGGSLSVDHPERLIQFVPLLSTLILLIMSKLDLFSPQANPVVAVIAVVRGSWSFRIQPGRRLS